MWFRVEILPPARHCVSNLYMWDLVTKYPIEFSTTWISIVPLIAFAYRRDFKGETLRYVLVFVIINITFQWWMLYKCSIRENNLFLWNAYIVIRYLFVASIFHAIFLHPLHRKALMVLLCLFLIIAALDWVNVGYERSFKYAQLAECVFGGSFCLMFYKELLIYMPVLYLLKMRMFYICSGLLLFYSGNLFLSPLSFYLNVAPYNTEMAVFIALPYLLESMLFLIISVGIVVKE